MAERFFFNQTITKNLTASNSDERFFEGILTVEMVDKQGEITVVDELMKSLPIWMDRGAPITDTHSNRVVGRGINFSRTTVKDAEGREMPAILIQGKIHKHYKLDDQIWEAMKTGKYKGLSFGGATRASRTPIQQSDGSVAYSLKDLEHYEVAVCEDPAVPLALITQTNNLAKAMAGNYEERGNGEMCIKCSKFGCYVDKNIGNTPVAGADNEKFEKTDKSEWADGKTEDDPQAKGLRDNPSPDGAGTGTEDDIGKTIVAGENLVTGKPIRGISRKDEEGDDPKKKVDTPSGVAAQGNTMKGETTQQYTNGKTQGEYDMTGIVNDKESDPKGVKKEVGITMEANSDEGGKPEGVNNDKSPDGLKQIDKPEEKEKDMLGQTGGTKGSFDTAEQGTGDQVRVQTIKEPKESPKKKSWKKLEDKLNTVDMILRFSKI